MDCQIYLKHVILSHIHIVLDTVSMSKLANLSKVPWFINTIVLDVGVDVEWFWQVQFHHIDIQENQAANLRDRKEHFYTCLTYFSALMSYELMILIFLC